MAKRGLGRGLGSLLQESGGGSGQGGGGADGRSPNRPGEPPNPQDRPRGGPVTGGTRTREDLVLRIPVSKITPNPMQPRREFDPESIEELSTSLKRDGVLQPLLVKPVPGQDGCYELIAGERRLRAARYAGLETVPVLVKENVTALEALQWALVENVQRRDLNPIEEALGYQRLVEEFEMTQAAVAEQVSKNRVSITHAMRLLKLPEVVQGWIADGSLSVGHAKAILGLPDSTSQRDLAAAAIGQGWNVRQTEEAVRKYLSRTPREESDPEREEEDATAVQRENWVVENLQRRFGARVRVQGKGGKGKIEVYYGSPDELERLLHLWGVREEL